MSANEFQVFSKGEVGRMHVLAHELTDQGRYELGSRVLGDWLEGKRGETSQDVHLHWHQGVFELGVSDWDAAYARFCEFILPAVEHGEAATDAPAMLWRLRLQSQSATPLPWEVVRAYALDSLQTEPDQFIVLHDLLALAGAGDVANLDHWLSSGAGRHGKVLSQLGQGLRAFASEDYRLAADAFEVSMPRLAEVGGSDAQRQLFHRMGEVALGRCSQ